MNRRLTLIKSQKDFYRNRYDRVIKILLVFLSLIILLGGILVTLFIRQPMPEHYASSLGGNLTHLTLLKERSNA